MFNIKNYLQGAISELKTKASAVKSRILAPVHNTQSRIVSASNQIKSGLVNETNQKKLQIKNFLEKKEKQLAVAKIKLNTSVGKVGTGINSANDFLNNKMGLLSTIAKTPQKYGTMAGEQIASGIKQLQSNQPSNLLGIKIPAKLAGLGKIGLGGLNLLPTSIVGNYAMDGAEDMAGRVFGKGSLATTGIALGAGLLAPSGTGKITTASKFAEAGQEILSKLPKQKRLEFLMGYSNDLLKLGFKKPQIEAIGAPMAMSILKNKISPAQWETLKSGKVITENKTIDSLSRAKNAFEDWVNSRRATQVEGYQKSKAFSDLKEKGLAGFFEFQSGKTTGKFAKVKTFFDNKYKELQEAGVKFGYKADYLPQLWLNTQDEIAQVYGKKLTQKPSFALASVIKTYEEGIAGGLTPRYSNVGDVAQWYEQTANKTLADRNFFNYLVDSRLIVKDTHAPNTWITLDPDRFPKFKVDTDKGTFSGNFKAEPELANAINNYLSNPEGGVATFAKISGALKNIYLTSGIPATGINFHGVNILSRFVNASNNPISGFFTGANYLLRPKVAQQFIDDNLSDLAFAVKHGLTASSEEHVLQTAVKEIPTSLMGKAYEGLKNFHKTFFDEPLFGKVIPALKMKLWKANYENLLQTHTKDEAGKIASEITNDMLGGINLDMLMRNKESQNIFRSLILAPDWMESNVRLGTGIVKAVTNPTDPKGKAYRIFARNYLLSYLTLNVANKVFTGHYAFENEAGHQFELEAGYTSDGQKRFIRPFGTSADFIRLPVDFMSGLISGDSSVAFRIVRNRLSPIAGQFVGQLTNTNYAGQRIANPDDSLPQQLLARLGEASGTFTPSYVSNPVRFLTGSGNLGPEQAITSTLELPVRYTGGAYNNIQKVATEKAKGTGASISEQIYNMNQSLKGQSLPDGYAKPEKFNLFNLFKKKEETSDDKTGIFKYMAEEQELDLESKLIRSALNKATSEEEANELLKASGINKTFEEATVTILKGFTTEKRAEYLFENMATMSNEEFGQSLNLFVTEKILTSAVVTELEESEKISPEKADLLKQIIKQKTGKKLTGGPKKPKKLALGKIKSTSVKLKIEKPSFKPLKKIKTPKLGSGVINKK